MLQFQLNPNATFGEGWGHGELLYLQFDVQDTGCGLTVDEKQLLFKRFSQASPRTRVQYGGRGLGLFISKQLTELHGGQIGVASEASQGSTFGFYIMAKRSNSPDLKLAQPDSPEEHDLQRAGLIVAEKALVIDAKDLCILVVEDNLINQKVLVKQLQKIGCTVSAASNGIEAFTYLETTDYEKNGSLKLSVILMDLEMPEMDGLTCVRKIRTLEAEGKIRRHVPIIAVTANMRQKHVAATKGSGMDDVVSKPFRIPDLLAKIEILLNQ